MKLIIIVFLFFSLESSAQKLDPFFEKDKSEYSIKMINDFYFNKGLEPSEIDNYAKRNSKILKKEDYYLYLMNELARAVFLKHSDDIKGALKLLEKLKNDPYLKKNKRLTAYHDNVTGNVYFQMGSLDKAYIYYQNAIQGFKAINDSAGWKGNLINTGNLHATKRNPDSAYYYYSQAWRLDSLGVEEHHLGLISNLARYYVSQNEIEMATKMYEEVHRYALEQGDVYAHVISSLNLGDCYYESGKYDLAIETLIGGKRMALDRGINMHISDFDRTISLCYSAQGNFEEAYFYLSSSDSSFRKANKRNLEEYAEKLTVKHQNEIHEKERLIYQSKIDRKKSEQNLLLLFLSILSVLLFIIMYLYFQKRKKNKILVKQNFELVEKTSMDRRKKSENKKVSKELIERIEHYLNQEKEFKNVELSLDKISRSLDTNRTYISENINAHYGYSFRVLLNKLRINEARKMLIDDKFSHYSIEGIATSVGYRNLSSFNSAFKKETGITPSYFRSNHRKS